MKEKIKQFLDVDLCSNKHVHLKNLDAEKSYNNINNSENNFEKDNNINNSFDNTDYNNIFSSKKNNYSNNIFSNNFDDENNNLKNNSKSIIKFVDENIVCRHCFATVKQYDEF
jgi:hypothetical protein